MKRYPIYIQDEENACGAYCIQSLLDYYHQKEEIIRIKEKCGLDKQGITIYGMLQALKFYHIEATAYKGELDELLKMNTYPCLLHTFTLDNRSHFVILYEKRKNRYIVADPAVGLLQLSEGELYYRYSGICIVIKQVGKKEDMIYQSFIEFIKTSFKKQKRLWLKNSVYAGSLFFLNFIFSFYYKWVIGILSYHQMNYLLILFICFFMIACLKACLNIFYQYFHLALERIFVENYTLPSFKNILNKHYSYFHQQTSSNILVKIQDMYTFPREWIHYISTILLEGLMILSSVFVLGIYYVDISIIYFLLIIVFIILTIDQHRHLEIWMKYMMAFLSNLQQTFLDIISSFQDIHQYHLNKKMSTLIEQKHHHYFNHYQQYQGYIIRYQTISQLGFELFLLFIFCLGAFSVEKEQFALDQLIFIYTLLSYSFSSVLTLATTLKETDKLKLSFERYKDLMYLEKENQKEVLDRITSIIYDQVSFGYGYRPKILNKCRLAIHGHLMIKGKNGSGKSTLMRLLTCPELDYQGKIFINGKDLKEYSKESLLQHIVYVSHETFLFEGSLKENILLDSSNEALLDSLLKKFNLEEIKERLDEHIDSSTAFSLGQKQCIGLLRIMLNLYDVLIIDESFSHLEDTLTKLMLKEILKIYQDRIVVMIFHQAKLTKSMFKGEIVSMEVINKCTE